MTLPVFCFTKRNLTLFSSPMGSIHQSFPERPFHYKLTPRTHYSYSLFASHLSLRFTGFHSSSNHSNSSTSFQSFVSFVRHCSFSIHSQSNTSSEPTVSFPQSYINFMSRSLTPQSFLKCKQKTHLCLLSHPPRCSYLCSGQMV